MMHVFVTGMFRSGTTMLARMLAAHEQTAFASDPFSRLFRSARNATMATLVPTESVDADAPLGDYYLDVDGIRLLQAIRTQSLGELPLEVPVAALASSLATAAEPYSPDLAPHLSGLKGNTCLDVLSGGMDLISKVYGGADCQVVGFKEVWVTEFVPAFLGGFPEGKAICIVRDPRAVYLSKRQQKERYPLLFMARQWRKLAALAWLWRCVPELRNRVLITRFEDLVLQPDVEIPRIADFLGLDGAGAMADPGSWTDGGGDSWSQNTSFGAGSRSFDASAVDRWRERLPERECSLVEWICSPEMALFGYECTMPAWTNPWEAILDPPLVDEAHMAAWIRPYVDERSSVVNRHLCSEFVRWMAIGSTVDLAPEIQQLLCLDPAIFQACRAELAGTEAACLS